MNYLPHIIGFFGVLAFAISYQQRTRRGIIAFTMSARALFVIQYIMLFAFEGAAQNGVGIVSALLAENKEKKFFKNTIPFWLGLVYILTITAGAFAWKNYLSVLPIIGMLLQNTALWITKPRLIRACCLGGIPFWITYNLLSGSYAGAVCDVISVISIVTAMIRHDFKKEVRENACSGETCSDRADNSEK